ncbi:MAG: alpha-L-fucosidase [Flavisolibacter sp.]
MNKLTRIKMIFLFLFFLAGIKNQAQSLPKPSQRQMDWQQMETNAFLHFTVNTFTDKEWGDGTESPSVFNPLHFDAGKMIKALKEAGFKMVILTAKHHDGFCLWPSAFTNHSVKYSTWKDGKGDVVREISEACKANGLKFGFYLSPWDRHEASYGTAAYNEYFKNQLRELLTNYGTISEVWFDGAKGSNAKDMQYDFEGYWKLVRQLQPTAVLFSDVGPDVRWVGNESGNAGNTCWSTINTEGMSPGKADASYLNQGDAAGKLWMAPETDVSIRPGWFYHPSEDQKVKSGKQLVDLYYTSVGRNSLLLLNIPPNRDGIFSEPDLQSILEFRKILNESFHTNLLAGITKKELTDGDVHTCAVLNANESIVINFKKNLVFDRACFQEDISKGQRVGSALLEYWDGKNWQEIEQFTTIGYKRLLRFPVVNASKVRFTVLKTRKQAHIAEMGLYKASSDE